MSDSTTERYESFDFQAKLKHLSHYGQFGMEGWYVWGASMARTGDGCYHLLFSRWPYSRGFNAWVTHSEIAYAVSSSPFGPFEFQSVALPARGSDYWDGHVTHNPTILKYGDKYYLYYVGNHGPCGQDANFHIDNDCGFYEDEAEISDINYKILKDHRIWIHRNNQRIGVAVADHPSGPWKRFDRPLIDINKKSWDFLISSNPSVTVLPDNRIMMVYKTVSDGKMPFGGKVLHAVAFSDSPAASFKRYEKPIFSSNGDDFPAEDPFVWCQNGHCYGIVKDMHGCFTGIRRSLALFESHNQLDWNPAAKPLVSDRNLNLNGTSIKLAALERTQIFFEDGVPSVLLCAAEFGDHPKTTRTFNLQLPLSGK